MHQVFLCYISSMNGDWKKVEDALKAGGIAVIPTDTIYGIVASAFNKRTVERVYEVRGRSPDKPCIILITKLEDLNKFGIKIISDQKKFLEINWPGKISIILNTVVLVRRYLYLHRGTETMAFRMIGKKNKNLFNLIEKVGPLIAPSANPEGLPPATSIQEAKKYFGSNIDVYVSTGTIVGQSSTLVDLSKDKTEILRQGKQKIKHP